MTVPPRPISSLPAQIQAWDVTWPELLEPGERSRLAGLLLGYVRERRWFRAKARAPRAARLADVIWLDAANVLVILRIEYDGDGADLYAVPLAHIEAKATDALAARTPQAIIARLRAGSGAEAGAQRRAARAPDREAAASRSSSADDGGGYGHRDGDGDGQGDGALADGLMVPGHAAEALFAILGGSGRVGGEQGELRGEADPLFARMAGTDALPVRIPQMEQTNSVAFFGDRVLFKIYRELTAGPNPELEVGRYLTRHSDPPCAPRVLGALSYRAHEAEGPGTDFSLGIAHEFLPNEGDAWTVALDEVRGFFRRAVDRELPGGVDVRGGAESLLARALRPEPEAAAAAVAEAVGGFLGRAATLGKRTGELHLALASAEDGPGSSDFAPEPLSADDRRGLAARAGDMLNEQFDALPSLLSRLTARGRSLAQRLLAPRSREAIAARLAEFRDRPIDAVKTRTHGDLHLGQVLCRGDDFVIIDFEGEPARPLAERRAKSSPLRDVMGMIRSFDYAPYAVLREAASRSGASAFPRQVGPWASLWTAEVTAAYLRGYLTTVAKAPFIPRAREELALLLGFHELEKVIYEMRYEANNRPDWVEIPLQGLATIVGLEGDGVDRAGEQR